MLCTTNKRAIETMANVKCRPSSIPRSIEAFVDKKIPSSEETECEKRGYKLTRTTLGKGAYAKVKLAYVTDARLQKDSNLMRKLKENKNNKVAVKIISKKNAPVEYLNKFMPREIDALNAINGNKNVMKLYETFRTENRIYLIMEYANKGDLLEFINTNAPKAPGIGETKAKNFFHQLITGIEHCHQKNIVHRDLKCENILIHDDEVIKISDFGFATRYPTTKHPLLETFCGSYAYAAPEVLQAEKYDGKKADIWSLGVVLFAMLNGKLPFNDKNVATLVEQTRGSLKFSSRVKLSQDCQDLVKKILQANPQKRMTIPEILCHSWMEQSTQQDLISASQSRGVPDGKSEKFIASPMNRIIDNNDTVDINEIAPLFNSAQANEKPNKHFALDKTPWKEANPKQSAMTKLLGSFHERKATNENTKNTSIEKQKSSDGLDIVKLNNESLCPERQHCTKPNASKAAHDKKHFTAFRYQGVREKDNKVGLHAAKKWNEVKIPISNMKTSGYYKLYYPGVQFKGLKSNERAPLGLSLPPVASQNRLASSYSNKIVLNNRADSRTIKAPKRHLVRMSANDSKFASVTTEIINLRKNWIQNRKDSRNHNLLTYYTLSGKEVEKTKPAFTDKIETKLKVYGRAARSSID